MNEAAAGPRSGAGVTQQRGRSGAGVEKESEEGVEQFNKYKEPSRRRPDLLNTV